MMPPIAMLQGADTSAIQQRLGAFVASHRQSLRIVGVLEIFDGDVGCSSKASYLRSVADGEEFALFQDLGSEASACSLLPEGVVQAGQAVCRQIAQGCDLVVLSKFGKLEAENGSGLTPAFVAAIEAGVPILSSVAPRYMDAWEKFASPFYMVLDNQINSAEAWWSSILERSQ